MASNTEIDATGASPSNSDSDWTTFEEYALVKVDSEGTLHDIDSESATPAAANMIEEPASTLLMLQDQGQQEQAADALIQLLNADIEHASDLTEDENAGEDDIGEAPMIPVQQEDPHNEMTRNMLSGVRPGTLRSGRRID